MVPPGCRHEGQAGRRKKGTALVPAEELHRRRSGCERHVAVRVVGTTSLSLTPKVTSPLFSFGNQMEAEERLRLSEG